jgi:hypothetical protein
MDLKDREKISSNLTNLSQVTQWNDDLESGLIHKNIFNNKMVEKIKVNQNFFYCENNIFMNH